MHMGKEFFKIFEYLWTGLYLSSGESQLMSSDPLGLCSILMISSHCLQCFIVPFHTLLAKTDSPSGLPQSTVTLPPPINNNNYSS